MRIPILILALSLCLASAEAQLVQPTPAVVSTATSTLGSAATSITVSVPAGAPTNRLTAIFVGRKDGTNSGGNLGIRFNGDSGANYDGVKVYLTSGGVVGSEAFTAQTSGVLGDTATLLSALANAADVVRVEVPFYADTTFFKSALSHRARDVSTEYLDSVLWHSTAAITSVTILTATDNFIAGSKLTLICE